MKDVSYLENDKVMSIDAAECCIYARSQILGLERHQEIKLNAK